MKDRKEKQVLSRAEHQWEEESEHGQSALYTSMKTEQGASLRLF
jgi:hypothetical protein